MSVPTTPLTATISAEIAGMKGRELVDPWVAVECLALLDRYGVLVYSEANVSDTELVDGAADERPQKATLLSAREVDEKGGDTEFATTYAAYEALTSIIRPASERAVRASA